jgi:hypothetical protein
VTTRSEVVTLVASLRDDGCACREQPLAVCLLHWPVLVRSLPDRTVWHLARQVLDFTWPERSWSR